MTGAGDPWLDPELTTLAFLWRLDRRDGVGLGFTSHDRDLVADGMVYRAAPGMRPSAIRCSDGMEVDTLDVAGALTHDAIRGDDLAAGRWDGARVRLFACDWTNPAARRLLARGELGAVGQEDDAFTAELAGPTALLEQPVVEQTSPECRAALGDARCRVAMAGRTRLVRIAAVRDAVTLAVDATEPVANAYGYGRLRWIDGGNGGLASAILSSDGTTVTLREPPPFAVTAGLLVEVAEGCDRMFATCVGRFGNAANFRGEPHLPGNDLLTRYPGA